MFLLLGEPEELNKTNYKKIYDKYSFYDCFVETQCHRKTLACNNKTEGVNKTEKLDEQMKNKKWHDKEMKDKN